MRRRRAFERAVTVSAMSSAVMCGTVETTCHGFQMKLSVMSLPSGSRSQMRRMPSRRI